MLEGIFGNKTAERYPFDHAKVKKWYTNEGAPEEFKDFEEKLKIKRKS